MFSNDVWTNKYGEKIPLKDMSNYYLRNLLYWCRRYHQTAWVERIEAEQKRRETKPQSEFIYPGEET